MAPVLLIGFVAIIIWSLVSQRFERLGFAGPAALVVLGAVAVLIDLPAFEHVLDTDVTERIVEVILALLLFVDACEVRGGVFGGVGRLLARLVFIALPLAIIITVITAGALLPDANPALLLVMACIVIPTDFSPSVRLLRHPRIPERIRNLLNVESGYNDGLVAPLFAMSLAIAEQWDSIVAALDLPDGAEAPEADAALEAAAIAFIDALPATLSAILVGAVCGMLVGVLTRLASARGFANASGIRYVMLLTPLLVYGITTLPGVGGNGFVAAFVAGIVYRYARVRKQPTKSIAHDEILLVEEVGTLAANFVWFMLGAIATWMFTTGIHWPLLLLALGALTVFRAAPVAFALLGSRTTWSERVTIGFIGPRGTASIVFGLLAYNGLGDDEGALVLSLTALTVLGSILLHGIATPPLLRRVPITPWKPKPKPKQGQASTPTHQVDVATDPPAPPQR